MALPLTIQLEDQPVNAFYPQAQIQSQMPVPYESHPAQTKYHTEAAGTKSRTAQIEYCQAKKLGFSRLRMNSRSEKISPFFVMRW